MNMPVLSLAEQIWWLTALVLVVLFAATVVASSFDRRRIDGVGVRAEPMKFQISLALHVATFALIVGAFSDGWRSGTLLLVVVARSVASIAGDHVRADGLRRGDHRRRGGDGEPGRGGRHSGAPSAGVELGRRTGVGRRHDSHHHRGRRICVDRQERDKRAGSETGKSLTWHCMDLRKVHMPPVHAASPSESQRSRNKAIASTANMRDKLLPASKRLQLNQSGDAELIEPGWDGEHTTKSTR